MESTVHVLLRPAAAAALAIAVFSACADEGEWAIPRASVRGVLQQWAQARGYGLMWSEGIPDFPTREGRASGEFAAVARVLVNGSAYGAANLYCPPGTTFPGTAYTPDARVDDQLRMVFVYGVPTAQECRPR